MGPSQVAHMCANLGGRVVVFESDGRVSWSGNECGYRPGHGRVRGPSMVKVGAETACRVACLAVFMECGR